MPGQITITIKKYNLLSEFHLLFLWFDIVEAKSRAGAGYAGYSYTSRGFGGGYGSGDDEYHEEQGIALNQVLYIMMGVGGIGLTCAFVYICGWCEDDFIDNDNRRHEEEWNV